MRVVPSQRARATRSTQRASGEPRACPSPARVRIVPGTAPSGHENGGTTWRSRRAGSRQDRAVGPRIAARTAASQPRFALETARCFRVKGRTCVVVSRDAMWRPRSTGQDRDRRKSEKERKKREFWKKQVDADGDVLFSAHPRTAPPAHPVWRTTWRRRSCSRSTSPARSPRSSASARWGTYGMYR